MVDIGEDLNLPLDIGTAVQGISKVNLRGGVVGKVALTVMVVSIATSLVAWSAHNIWISAAAIAAIFIIAFTMLWRLISFADRHPQAALLEGAEFLVHEQMLQGSKNHPMFRVDPRDRVQSGLRQDHTNVYKGALEPDLEIGQLESSDAEGGE